MNKKKNLCKRFLAIVLVVSILIPLIPVGIMKVNADASAKLKIDYRALIELYKNELGLVFDTPMSRFNVKIKDGNTHFVAPMKAEDYKPHEKTVDMPVIDTIKLGQTFSLEDKSILGSGSKFISWDWQVVYRDENGVAYDSKNFSERNPSNIPGPTKPGSVGIYLNAADNYKAPQIPNHFNASSHGNWRTAAINKSYKIGNYDMVVKGWYFTGAILEVESENDIGLHNLKLYNSAGTEVAYIEPNKPYSCDVVVSHLKGNKITGEHPVTNPKVTVEYSAMEIGNNEIMPSPASSQTNSLLYPGKSLIMPKSHQFTSGEGVVRVCAIINKKHHELGYNSDISNDVICRDYGMIKNYAISNIKSFPQSIAFGKDENKILNHPISFNFTVSNETSADSSSSLPSSVKVEIKNNKKLIWSNYVSVGARTSENFNIETSTDIYPGDNNFTIEVNPDRTQKEMKPGMDNPYIDNKGGLSIRGIKYKECQECKVESIRNKNNWKEEWSWHEQHGNVKSSSYSKCTKRRKRKNGKGSRCVSWKEVPYEYCDVYYSHRWKEVHSYYEDYKINKVRFGSKYHQDVYKDRLKVIPNYGEAKIKAGYGFELEVETTYKTNRGNPPKPSPYERSWYQGDRYGRYGSGYCDFIRRSPGVTPVNAPKKIYVEMPYMDRNGDKNVCYILNDYIDKGSWNNLTRTFRLPRRQTPSGGSERRIYISKNAYPNNTTRKNMYPIKIATPRPDKPDRFYGYVPENPVSGHDKSKPQNYLHDCHTVYIVIYPQDDIKSHITQ